MTHHLRTAAFVALACTLGLTGCHSKPPRQAESPDALADKGADKGADMSSGADTGGNIAVDDTSGVAKMHEKCCKQCASALAKDRSGGKPNTIPCADFTADLDPFCLEHFRGKKTMASECK